MTVAGQERRTGKTKASRRSELKRYNVGRARDGRRRIRRGDYVSIRILARVNSNGEINSDGPTTAIWVIVISTVSLARGVLKKYRLRSPTWTVDVKLFVPIVTRPSIEF